MCEGMVRFMQQGIDALSGNDRQLYQEKLARVGEIVLALKAALDLSQRDAVGLALDAQYQALDRQILSAQHAPNVSQCHSILQELRSLRDMWDAIASYQNRP